MPINYRKYPPNWKEIRQRILTRADNKCEICKVPNGEIICRGMYNGVPVWQDEDGKICSADNGEVLGYDYVGEVCWRGQGKFIKVVLTVHHMDNDPTNWDVKDERLQALCQRDHFLQDADLHKKNSAETRRKRKGMQQLF